MHQGRQQAFPHFDLVQGAMRAIDPARASTPPHPFNPFDQSAVRRRNDSQTPQVQRSLEQFPGKTTSAPVNFNALRHLHFRLRTPPYDVCH
jgi:hypothetical protein